MQKPVGLVNQVVQVVALLITPKLEVDVSPVGPYHLLTGPNVCFAKII